MLNISAIVKESNTALQDMKAALKELAATQVLVGIPDSDPERRQGGISNAALLYIHTNGSPLQGIPPRPIIEPALEDAKERIGQVMGEAAKAGMDGDKGTMRRNLNRAGQEGQNVARGWFVNPKNNWAALKPETAKRKEAKGANVERPLIDTGALRQAITFVVREK